ncbi:methyltransferase [Flavobacterium sp.]|uniref:methyltransferase n=1 Tax=Flavobacterium sp. TaxID=239 RepID=UPI003B9900AD
MYEHTYPKKRFEKTLAFVKKHLPAHCHILDLGVENPLGELLKKEGFNVQNTSGEDLDIHQDGLHINADAVTAFEIFEHLLNPFTVLQNVKSHKLVASVPLRLWFSPAYRSKNDVWDRHFHEFEDWQFDWLLEKAGWKIIATEKWTHPVNKIGIRPLLHRVTPRYYIVYAERIIK